MSLAGAFRPGARGGEMGIFRQRDIFHFFLICMSHKPTPTPPLILLKNVWSPPRMQGHSVPGNRLSHRRSPGGEAAPCQKGTCWALPRPCRVQRVGGSGKGLAAGGARLHMMGVGIPSPVWKSRVWVTWEPPGGRPSCWKDNPRQEQGRPAAAFGIRAMFTS